MSLNVRNDLTGNEIRSKQSNKSDKQPWYYRHPRLAIGSVLSGFVLTSILCVFEMNNIVSSKEYQKYKLGKALHSVNSEIERLSKLKIELEADLSKLGAQVDKK